MFHISDVGEQNLNTNGYYVIASAKDYDELLDLIKTIRSIYEHPTYEEIELVVSAFPNQQDTNL
jgi:UDP-N-acetyl-D-mannosaminuronate dehydrogenase